MVHLKSEKEIEILREGGAHLASILHELKTRALPGVTTRELDMYAEKRMRDIGGVPILKGYKPHGAKFPFPATVCISVNSVVVHGIPGEYVLQDGDVVGFDTCLLYKDMVTDSAITVPVGKVSKENKKLIEVTERAMYVGIDAAESGKTTHTIGQKIEEYVNPHGYGIVTTFGGHGVGYKVHEDPYVPNYDMGKGGEKLVPGLVITVEPMLILGGTDDVYVDKKDGYSVYSKDKSCTAHFEHTIVITKNGPEILTQYHEHI